MLRRRRAVTLRTHLLLLVGVTALPVMVVAAVLVSRDVIDDRVETERRLLEAARAGAAVVDAEVQGTIRALHGLAQSDRLVDGQLEDFRGQAQRVLATQPTWTAVSLSTIDLQFPLAASAPGRVLVVDDNRDALLMLLEALKQAGIEAVGAETAKDAMEVAVRIRPDVAVLDIGLPDKNGLDLARALRVLPGGACTRLIAVSGYGRVQDKAAARAAGFDAFFPKPVDITTLLVAMERVPETPHAQPFGLN